MSQYSNYKKDPVYEDLGEERSDGRSSQCRGPKAGTRLAGPRTRRKNSVVGTSLEKERHAGSDVGDEGRKQITRSFIKLEGVWILF